MEPWRAGNEFQFPGLFSFQNLGYQIWNPIIRAVVVRKPMCSLWINQRYWLILACVAAGPRIVYTICIVRLRISAQKLVLHDIQQSCKDICERFW